jgi:hypothetical protein
MPEADRITYSLKELTELMLRDQGIRSGLWMIVTRFGYTSAYVAAPEPGGPTGPAVVSVLAEVGIQKVPEPGPLSIDASQIWQEQKAKPKSAAAPKKRTR